MTAALAQCAGRATIIIFAQANAVHIRGGASHGKSFAHSLLLLFVTVNYFRLVLTADLDLAGFLVADFFTAAFFAGAAFAFATVFFAFEPAANF